MHTPFWTIKQIVTKKTFGITIKKYKLANLNWPIPINGGQIEKYLNKKNK